MMNMLGKTRMRTAEVLASLLRAATICLGVLVPEDALAQRGQTSAIVGTVRDATGQVLAGVAVTLESPQQIGGPETVESDPEGRFRAVALLPGIYTLTATAPGFARLQRTDVELLAGLTHTLDLVLSVAPVDTAIEIRASVPTIDVTTSTPVQLVERALLENLPISFSRSVIDFINLAPGVADRVALGGAALANPLSIDGTSAASPVQGAPDAEPSINWVETVQIVTVAANAEFGEFTTARINAVTRSGANRFAGLGDYWWTRRTWAKFNELLEWNDLSGQVGGPVRRDRLWFFAGADRNEQIRRVSAFADRPRTPDEPLVEDWRRRLIGKLTAAPTTSMRLEGYVTNGPSRSLNGNAAPNVAADALGVSEGGQRLHNLRWTWPPSDDLLVEARIGGYESSFLSGPPPERRSGPPPHIDNPTFFSVNYPQIYEDRRRTGSAHASVTRTLTTTRRGVHEIKAGVEHERARNRALIQWPGNARFLDRNGQPDIVMFHDGSVYNPSHHRTSLFVQDAWQFGALTFEPGLRASFYGGHVPNAASSPYTNHMISPRLGVAWDVNPDHRTVVRAHYGHYHDAMSTRFYEFLDAAAESETITARVLGPNQYEEISRIGGPTRIPAIDPATKHSYAEEWVAAIEREILPRLSVRAQYVRRNTRQAMGFIDVGTAWTPQVVTDPGPDGVTGTGDDGGLLTIFLNEQGSGERYVLTNPVGAERHYDAVQLVGSRRFHNGWSLQVSYTWGRTDGNFDNENGSNAANTDLGRGGNFSNPNRAINTTGRTVFDRRHDLRAFGTFLLPYWGGLSVSGVYRYTSGAPWARLQNFDPRTQAFGIRVEPLGTREYPATHEADLRVEKTYVFPGGVTTGLYGDVFNVTNHSVVSRVQEFSGPSFGNPQRFTLGRRLRVGVRVTF
jgi:hypothetical protein